MQKIRNFVICFILIGIALPCAVFADELDALRLEIQELENKLTERQKTLEDCASKNKNFKIAGSVLLATTAAGGVGNIVLYKKNKELVDDIKRVRQYSGNLADETMNLRYGAKNNECFQQWYNSLSINDKNLHDTLESNHFKPTNQNEEDMLKRDAEAMRKCVEENKQ